MSGIVLYRTLCMEDKIDQLRVSISYITGASYGTPLFMAQYVDSDNLRHYYCKWNEEETVKGQSRVHVSIFGYDNIALHSSHTF